MGAYLVIQIRSEDLLVSKWTEYQHLLRQQRVAIQALNEVRLLKNILMFLAMNRPIG